MIELVVVLAIAGVLLGIVAVSLDSSRFAVNQAARGVASSVTRARFEALKNNTNAGIAFQTTAPGGYLLCLDGDLSGTCDSSETLETVSFGSGDLGRVRLTNATPQTTVMFDRRGVSINGPTTVTIQNAAASYSRTVVILTTGKADVQ